MSAPTKPKKATKPKPARDTIGEATALLSSIGPFDEDGNVIPVIIGDGAEDEQVHVFTLDGVDYFVPKHPNRLVLGDYLRSMRSAKTTLEQDAATLDLIAAMLGDEGLAALKDRRVSSENSSHVTTIVLKVAMDEIGELRRSLGN